MAACPTLSAIILWLTLPDEICIVLWEVLLFLGGNLKLLNNDCVKEDIKLGNGDMILKLGNGCDGKKYEYSFEKIQSKL